MTPKSENNPRRIALYPGSFNPFTKGHLDILSRALSLFDEVIVCIGCNPTKDDGVASAERRASALRSLLAPLPRVTVATYTTLTAAYARSVGACCLIRGLRSAADLGYEVPMADANMDFAGLETIFLAARPELSFISSSLVRELRAFGENADGYLPTPEDVAEILRNRLLMN